MKAFFDAVEEARQEYETYVLSLCPTVAVHLTQSRDYKPELDKLAEERKAKTEADKKAQLDRLMKDMSMSEKPDKKGENPFGPYPSQDRVDL
jgi:oligoendopeptidase F